MSEFGPNKSPETNEGKIVEGLLLTTDAVGYRQFCDPETKKPITDGFDGEYKVLVHGKVIECSYMSGNNFAVLVESKKSTRFVGGPKTVIKVEKGLLTLETDRGDKFVIDPKTGRKASLQPVSEIIEEGGHVSIVEKLTDKKKPADQYKI